MELQKVNEQQELAKKENMVKFVHDVADMEVRAFTLQEAIRKCRKDLDEKAKEEEHKYKQKIHERDREKANVKFLDWKKQKKSEYIVWPLIREEGTTNIGCTFVFWLIFLSLGATTAIGLPLTLIPKVSAALDSYPSPSFMLWLFSNLIFIIAVFLICLIASLIKRGCAKRKCLHDRHRAEETLANLEKELVNVEKELTDFHEYQQTIEQRIQYMQENEKQLRNRISECYALSVVKPAYQNLICMVVLNEIFTNDKADTMREAMILCDTELRHAELIGKLDEVVNALNALANAIHGLNHVLHSIDTNVSYISQDVNRMTDNQSRIAYAAEALQKSAENTDFYIAQKRAGSL